jgi:hypothetical protein
MTRFNTVDTKEDVVLLRLERGSMYAVNIGSHMSLGA